MNSARSSTSGKTPRPTTVEEILGRARSTLDQSRQFRSVPTSAVKISPVHSRISASGYPAAASATAPTTTTNTAPASATPSKINTISEKLNQDQNANSKPKPKPGSNLYFRRPSSPTTQLFLQATANAKAANEAAHEDDAESSSSASVTSSSRSLKSAESGSGTSSGSASDVSISNSSTITPPTITDTPVSSKKDPAPLPPVVAPAAKLKIPKIRAVSASASQSLQKKLDDLSLSLDDSFSSNQSKTQSQPVLAIKKKNKIRHNLLAKNLLLRGDPVSDESYLVLEAMISEKESKSKSYSEDWISEIQSVGLNRENYENQLLQDSYSIEIPKTESEELELPEDISLATATATFSGNAKHTSSSRMIEEIVDNLQDLTISDERPPIASDDEAPTMAELNAMADLEILEKEMEAKQEEGSTKSTSRSVRSNRTITGERTSKSEQLSKNNETEKGLISVSKAGSKKSVTISLSGVSGASGGGGGAPSVKSASAHSKSTNKQSKSKKSMKSAKSSAPSSAFGYDSPDSPLIQLTRKSTRRTFQEALSKVRLTDGSDAVQRLHDMDMEYIPPTTKPQSQIQLILEKEVYRKELRRLRRRQEREENERKRVEEAKEKTIEAIFKRDSSKVKFMEPSFSKIKLTDLKSDLAKIGSTSRNFGTPYFGFDGSVNPDMAYEDLPRTPDDDFASQADSMDIPELVQEVVASNERMYNMTLNAAMHMTKEYGKSAKIISKLKKSRDAQRRHVKRTSAI